MTRATQSNPVHERAATDAELQRRVIERAEQFEAQGFIVTRQLEVEARGAADLLSVTTDTLRQWRCYGVGRHGAIGPRSRSGAGLAWYPIPDLLAWAERRETDRRPVDPRPVDAADP